MEDTNLEIKQPNTVETWLAANNAAREQTYALPNCKLPIRFHPDVSFITLTNSRKVSMPKDIREELLRMMRGESFQKKGFSALKKYQDALRWFAIQVIAHPTLFSGRAVEGADNINIARIGLHDLEWVFKERSGLTAAETF